MPGRGKVGALLALSLASAACNHFTVARSTPAIEVALTSAPVDARLMLLYDEAGIDPLVNHAKGAVWHVTFCAVANGKCSAAPTRLELASPVRGWRSIQVRLLNGHGNPIIGGVRWKGGAPSRVSLRCDMDRPVARGCNIAGLDEQP